MKKNILFSIIFCYAILVFFISCKKSNSVNNSGNNNTSDSANTIYASTIAGNNSLYSFTLGPTGVTTDAQGNVYASGADADIIKISSTGTIIVFAGTKNNPGCETGTGPTATFTDPIAICSDAQGNIYAADYNCDGIKKITASAVVTKFCSSDIAQNVFIQAQTICIDPQGNIYSANNVGSEGIAKTTVDGVVSRFAGAATTGYMDGSVSTAGFEGPTGLCADGQGNLYVADAHRIRKISNGQVTTLAGNTLIGYADGKGSAAKFGGTMGICMGPDGNIYIADTYNNMIRMMTPDGVVTTVTGSGASGFKDGAPSVTQFNEPINLCFDSKGNMYVADYGNELIRKITFPK